MLIELGVMLSAVILLPDGQTGGVVSVAAEADRMTIGGRSKARVSSRCPLNLKCARPRSDV